MFKEVAIRQGLFQPQIEPFHLALLNALASYVLTKRTRLFIWAWVPIYIQVQGPILQPLTETLDLC